jgi:DHA1 family multidrug resistance protein-like MFS transporter
MDSDGDPGWRRGVFVIWLSQFFSMAAFGFSLPFVAYFVQEDLGITDHQELVGMLATFHAIPALIFLVMAPVWGLVADRFGRKPMLVRANLAVFVVIVGMGMAQSVGWLYVCRAIQGLFTGTISASMSLGTALAPRRAQALVLGILASAIDLGAMAGNWLGGCCAERYGYRVAFFVGGGMALVAAALVAFGVRERFQPPVRLPDAEDGTPWSRVGSVLAPLWPVLLLLVCSTALIMLDAPVLPLLVQEVNGGIAGAAGLQGELNALRAVVSLPAAIAAGWLAGRLPPGGIVAAAAIGAAACAAGMAEVQTVAGLFLSGILLSFSDKWLYPTLNAWINSRAQSAQRGLVFGLAASVRSLGWFLGPILGAGLAADSNLRRTYWVMAAGLVGLAIIALAVGFRRAPSNASPIGSGPGDEEVRGGDG